MGQKKKEEWHKDKRKKKAIFILVYNTKGWLSFSSLPSKTYPFSLSDSSKDQTNNYAWFCFRQKFNIQNQFIDHTWKRFFIWKIWPTDSSTIDGVLYRLVDL